MESTKAVTPSPRKNWYVEPAGKVEEATDTSYVSVEFPVFQIQAVNSAVLPGVAAAAGQVNATRKKFRGLLSRAESGGWQIVWSDEPPVKPGPDGRYPAPAQGSQEMESWQM